MALSANKDYSNSNLFNAVMLQLHMRVLTTRGSHFMDHLIPKWHSRPPMPSTRWAAFVHLWPQLGAVHAHTYMPACLPLPSLLPSFLPWEGIMNKNWIGILIHSLLNIIHLSQPAHARPGARDLPPQTKPVPCTKERRLRQYFQVRSSRFTVSICTQNTFNFPDGFLKF